MSKKLDKKLRRYLKRHKSPKTIAGVKVPKALRDVADSPLGAAIIAQMLIGAPAAVKLTPRATKLRKQARAFAGKLAGALQETEGKATSLPNEAPVAAAKAPKHADQAPTSDVAH
jgi:hypothetical protein